MDEKNKKEFSDPGSISRKRNFRWRPEIFRWIVLLLGVAFWVSTSGYALDSSEKIPSALAAIPTKAHRFWKLLDQSQNRETVRAIVRLKGTFVAEGRLSGGKEVAEQRADIALRQEQVLNHLKGQFVRSMKKFNDIPFLALELDHRALASLENHPLIADIEEDSLSQPALNETIPLIGVPSAWSLGFDGRGWTVAVLDTGVDFFNPYFFGRIVGGACFSDSCEMPAGINCSSTGLCDHGTYIAGIVAANSGGPANNGVAKGATILPIQIFSKTDYGIESYKSDQISALNHVYGLRGSYHLAAVNISVRGELYPNQDSCDADNPSTKFMFDLLRSVDIAPVVPSGNDGDPNQISYPACISSAISVGGTTKGDQIAGFSNSAEYLSLLAPGADVFSTTIGGGWILGYSGTSLAAPHVSGTWAILKQAAPKATVDQILAALQDSGVPIKDPRNGLTKSRIQVDKALKALDHKAPQSQMTALPTVSGILFPLSWSGTDEVSGLGSYDVQVREGYEGVWADFLPNTTETSASFTGSHGKTYFFRVRARDRIGNLEPYCCEEWGQTFTTVLTSPAPVLVTSHKYVSPRQFQGDQRLSYTIRLQNTGNKEALASLEDTPPSTLTVFPGTLVATAGLSPAFVGGKISWSGTVPVSGEVRVTYAAVPKPGLPWLTPQINTVQISGSVLGPFSRSAEVIRAYGVWLPLIMGTVP
jgi:subtilisin